MSLPFRAELRRPAHPAEHLGAESQAIITAVTLNEYHPGDLYGSPEQLMAAALASPDELCLYLAVTRSGVLGRLPRGEEGRIIREARTQAAAEGHVWTPRLDVLALHRAWPDPYWPTGTPADPSARALSMLSDYGLSSDESPWAVVQPLADWIASAPASALERLLPFRWYGVRLLLARHARVFSPKLLTGIMQQRTALLELAANPHLREADVAHLAAQILDVPHSPGMSSSDRDRLPVLRSFAARAVGLPATARARLTALLAGQGPSPSPTEVRDDTPLEVLAHDTGADASTLAILGSCTLGPRTGAALFVHPRTPPAVRARLLATVGRPSDAEDLARLRQAVAELPGSREDDLLELLDVGAPPSSTVALAMIQSPGAGPALWTRLATLVPLAQVRAALAANPQARAVPAVRAVLRTSVAQEVIEGLLHDASGTEFPVLFERLVAKDSGRALDRLEGASDAQLTRMTRADVAPLFASPDREVRVRVMRLLSRLASVQGVVQESAMVERASVRRTLRPPRAARSGVARPGGGP